MTTKNIFADILGSVRRVNDELIAAGTLPAGIDQSRDRLGMRQFMSDVRKPCSPRLQFSHQRQRLLLEILAALFPEHRLELVPRTSRKHHLPNVVIDLKQLKHAHATFESKLLAEFARDRIALGVPQRLDARLKQFAHLIRIHVQFSQRLRIRRIAHLARHAKLPEYPLVYHHRQVF